MLSWLFAKKMTELEQFLFGPAEFSDIWDFSNIADFHGFGGRFNIPAKGQIFGPET